MADVVQGVCRCGAVEYQITGDPAFTSWCHCVGCRTAHGAALISGAGIPIANFKWLKGEDKLGKFNIRFFCTVCGTRLINDLTSHGTIMTFQSHYKGGIPEKFKPKSHINYESRLMDFSDSLPKFKGFAHEGVMVDNQGNIINK